jgi:hypothetical protein
MVNPTHTLCGAQDWEVQDPPCGCLTDGPLLATGRYLITRRTDELVRLLSGLVEDACGGAEAGLGG